jgi:hypothetical protein
MLLKYRLDSLDEKLSTFLRDLNLVGFPSWRRRLLRDHIAHAHRLQDYDRINANGNPTQPTPIQGGFANLGKKSFWSLKILLKHINASSA